MKSNSLGRFRRRRRLRKFFLLLTAVAIGFLIAAEGRYAFFRVSDISVAPYAVLPQHAVWGTVSPKEERFWPLLWFNKNGYEALVEEYYPVEAKLSLCGAGKFSLSASPLTPVLKVYWGGKLWYLSEDGRLWSAALAENKILTEDKTSGLPVLSWGADRATPINLSAARGNIYASSLPLSSIKSWYDMTEELGWTSRVKFIQATVKEDASVVRIIFGKEDGGNGAALLLPDDAKMWRETGAAVDKLYNGVENIPPYIFIDGTYEGKILIRGAKSNGENKSENAKAEP